MKSTQQEDKYWGDIQVRNRDQLKNGIILPFDFQYILLILLIRLIVSEIHDDSRCTFGIV